MMIRVIMMMMMLMIDGVDEIMKTEDANGKDNRSVVDDGADADEDKKNYHDNNDCSYNDYTDVKD